MSLHVFEVSFRAISLFILAKKHSGFQPVQLILPSDTCCGLLNLRGMVRDILFFSSCIRIQELLNFCVCGVIRCMVYVYSSVELIDLCLLSMVCVCLLFDL